MKKLFLLLAMVGMLATACESDSGVEDDNGNKTEQPGNGGGDDDAENPMNTLTSIAHFNPTGSATFNASAEGVFVTTKYEVLPKSCATLLAAEWKEYLKAQAIYPDSEDINYIDMPITEVVADEENGAITVTASGENLSNDFYGKKQAASMRLVASDGNKEVRSEFKTLVVGDKWFVTNLPTPAANEIYYIADALVNPKNIEVKSNIYDYTKGYYIITLTDEIHTIGEEAFSGRDNLTSITIPDSVTSIGDGAFRDCSSLTSIIIPDSVTSIGDGAFMFCSSLTSFYGKFASSDNRCLIVDGVLKSFAPANLTSYTIPDSVTSIGEDAFSGCTNLTSIIIPYSVTSIGDEAFSGCSSLTSVDIDYGVTSIGDKAFYQCSNLNSIIILDSVTSIGDEAFYQCSSLNSIIIPDSVTSIGKSAFSGCTNLTSIIIPNSVTSIGDEAFYQCSSLNSIIILDSVTSIGENAFSGCTNLTSVDIGFGVTSIGKSAFSGCTNLTSIIIPDSVNSIGDEAFSGCSSLTSVDIDYGVTSIGEGAFSGCYNLKSVTIPDSVTEIGSYAFRDCNSLKSVTIPDSVTEIGDWAFNNCTGELIINSNCLGLFGGQFTTLTIGDSVTSIGEGAFMYGDSLKSVTIGDSVTSIGENAFSGCTNLTSVTIGDSVTSIGEAFLYCNSLRLVYCKPITPPAIYYRRYNNEDYFGSFPFNSGMTIYVPRSAYDSYMQARVSNVHISTRNWYVYRSYIQPYDFE